MQPGFFRAPAYTKAHSRRNDFGTQIPCSARDFYRIALAVWHYAACVAAQLSSDARGAIPHDVQQLVVVDYRAMQNSDSAMQLRDRVMPPDLKQFDDALQQVRH